MTIDPQALVERYLDTFSNGTPEDVAALYADDATLEDPVGCGEVHIGREAIKGFYTNGMAVGPRETELVSIRVGGHEAAFMFTILITAGDTKLRIEPIEVMSFNGEGKIASMKAYWSPADITQL